MANDETWFITGFPGFIASRLIQRLARRTDNFILLVHPSMIDRARQEVGDLTANLGRSAEDFLIFQGDISEAGLSLSVAQVELISSQVTRVFHLAAVYDLAVPRSIAQRVNVGGTKNVNAFAKTLPHLKQYHYVSTCYVAGKREGRIFETELKHDAGFRNFYEESKYQSELEVESLKPELPVTIHRPSVVCGDSRTGETAKYDGVYYLIHYLLRWPSLLSQLNIGNHEVSLNLVPVDFVVDAMTALATDVSAIGKTVHLADPEPLTTNQLFNAIAQSIGNRHSRFTVPPRLVRFFLMLPPSPKITGLPHHGVPYFFVKQTYDTSIASELLMSHGIQCPPFRTYVDTIVGFAARHPVL